MIELMIVIVVVSVLAAIAMASYQSSVIKARRSDAKEALIHLSLEQERFRSNCPNYATSITAARTCAARGLGLPNATSENQYYNLSLLNVTTIDYDLRAVAVAGTTQAKDTGCTQFDLDKAGNKMPADCW